MKNTVYFREVCYELWVVCFALGVGMVWTIADDIRKRGRRADDSVAEIESAEAPTIEDDETT
jgi:hypothetical protein